ncbi:MAG: carboxypeptidase regulatory-like domain-containing protein [Acidobacteriota bacterium]
MPADSRSAVVLAFAAVFLSVTTIQVQAQTFQGGLRGTVRDAQGVVPAAAVILVNEDTKVARETVSNAAGEYSFPAVAPGTYTVRANLAGFKTFELKGVRIGTQQFVNLDVALEVGTISETVTVSGQSPIIETGTASTGETLEKTVLESLPTVGRNVFLMANMVPTMVTSGDTHWNRMQDQTGASLISLGGGGVRQNNYLLDGFPVTDIQNRSATNPSIESVEEVKVQVHTYDAEMGRTGGGVFNVTAKSGTNAYRGSGYIQIRPNALINENFFLKRRAEQFGRAKDPATGEEIGKPEEYWHNGGGGFGGPIVRNKTFFWFATEAYRDGLAQNGNLRFPTLAERNGDFSATTDSQGRQVRIFDPLTTRLVNGVQTRDQISCNGRLNVICPDRMNAVGRSMVGYLPVPDLDVSNGSTNYFQGDVVKDQAFQTTLKLDHQFSGNNSLSGFYLRQETHEPNTNFFRDNKFAAPSYQLDRWVNAISINHTYVMNSSMVTTLRFGWNTFDDDNSLPFPFDAHTLGFNPIFADAIPVQKFPALTFTGYNGTGFTGQQDRQYYSWGVNGTMTKLFGAHSFKWGADYRQLGVDALSYGQSAGDFTFNGTFTQGPNALSPSAATGNAIADLLLGFPSAGSMALPTPINAFTRYYSGFLQDDWRPNGRFTLNFGLRLEHEAGLMEENDHFTVGFDYDTISPLNSKVTLPIDPLTGQRNTVKGGLIFAGVNGAPRHQGNPPAVKVSPRAGVVFSMNDKTVVRGGYGIFYGPWNYPAPGTTGYAQYGYTGSTTLSQNTLVPITAIDNPFPGGLQQPTENTLGLLTGTGGNIGFIDPDKGAPRIQQYSFDVQRELPGGMSLTVGYVGSRGDNLGWGGTANTSINVNQLDPKYFALGTQLTQAVPNPFFGIPEAGSFASQSTIQFGQLLRPFPQFGNITMTQSTGAKSLYHAGVFTLRKRMSGWWAGSITYTLSKLEDNQFGQDNYYSAAPGLLDNYTVIPGSVQYNPDSLYGLSLLDSPHKLVIAPIVRIPVGEGRRYLNDLGALDYLIGGWTVSFVGTIQSGFPLGVTQNNNNTGLFGANQRPNVKPGVDFLTPGDITDRLKQDINDNRYLNADAFELAPAQTFGNAPRILPGVRGPGRSGLDMALSKDIRMNGDSKLVLRIEVINLTNTPWYAGFASTAFGNAQFGQITTQANYSRLTQITARYVW